MPDLLFELVCEELPPRDVEGATRALERALGEAFAQAGLAANATSCAWTPRRMAVWAHDLPDRSPDAEEVLRGPKVSVAFDGEGNPTPAATGFARKSGVTVEELRQEDGRVVATARTSGRTALEVAAEILPTLPGRVPWRKTMTWGAEVAFARPIRAVVALLSGEVVACTVAGIEAGRATSGHPFLAPGDVELDTAHRDDYLERLRKAYVLADADERSHAVLSAVHECVPDLDVDEALLSEVTNMVEWPSALVGHYDERYLALPPRLLTTVMAHHQRFFPVRGADGALEPRFVCVMDRDESSRDVCRPGFERVLLPRLHDAEFFMKEDRKRKLVERVAELEDVVYHRKLGTLRVKAARLEELAAGVAGMLGFGPPVRSNAGRAGLLAKCDLVTLQVGEFPELQGYVGAVYAAADGEAPEVCGAIEAQYRHRFADDDRLGEEALALVLAENLDVLCRFGTKVGLPKGNTDPFGVRRAAITVLEVSSRWARDLNFRRAVKLGAGDDTVFDYLVRRLRQRARDQGARPDHLDAITSVTTIAAFEDLLGDLRTLSGEESFDRLLEVAQRCRNITKKAEIADLEVREDLLDEPAEKALYAAWTEARAVLPQDGALRGEQVSRLAAAIAEPLHTFFDEVFVNVDDGEVRANRHALLRDIDRTLLRFADLCRVVRANPSSET